MTEVIPAKRVLPARERRESAAKRYSPAPPSVGRRKTVATKSTTPSTPATNDRPKKKAAKRVFRTPSPSNASTPPVEDTLPTKVTSSKPLPVTRQKQASKLSSKEYQSIAESAILATSLHRSRMQWLSDGIFKKYWVKPLKRKGVIEQPPDNPDGKAMVKLGTGTITIEPHKFDVTFYTVREQHPPPPYKHPNQHTAKAPATNYPMAPPYTPYKPPTPAQSAPQTPALQTPSPTASQPQNAPVKQEPPATAVKLPTPMPAGNPPTQRTVQTSSPAPKINSDPVIQMLAARAATDPQLKDLMKVVATSKANAEQLKEFQKHIDEFNAVVKQQEAEKQERERAAAAQMAVSQRAQPVQTHIPQQDPSQPGGPQAAAVSTTAQQQVGAAAPTTTATATYTAVPGAAHPSVFTTSAPRPPAPQFPAYPAPPRMEAHIKHIVVEFTSEGASTDRYLFPAYAALDMTYGAFEMLASFLVERKGSDVITSLGDNSLDEVAAVAARWQPEVEYYQPVTIKVRANQHRTIETIARAAKTLPEVQEHMRRVLESKTRAPVEYLVHQLPREKGIAGSEVPSAELVDSGVEMGSEGDDEDDELKAWYGNNA